MLITKANKTIQQVLVVDCSCANLCTQAKLLHKLGNDSETAHPAQEAGTLGTKDKTDAEGATELLAGISQKRWPRLFPRRPR